MLVEQIHPVFYGVLEIQVADAGVGQDISAVLLPFGVVEPPPKASIDVRGILEGRQSSDFMHHPAAITP